MNIQRKNKILIWTALVLLVLNLSTIGTIWVEKRIDSKKHCESKTDRKNYHKNVLIDELRLNENQIEFYQQSRKQHWVQIKKLKRKIGKTKADVHAEIFSAKPDTMHIYKLIDSIGFYNAEIERNNYRHFLELKEQLDTGQVVRFHELMDGMLKSGNTRNENYREKKKNNED
jgi:hypothetical protein